MTLAREAEKAGTWYPADPEVLTRLLDRQLAAATDAAAFGPPATAFPPGEAVAGIVPHAGLEWSGPVAARVYAWLSGTLAPSSCCRPADPPATAFLLFGACHRMAPPHAAVWPRGTWRTPLGPLRVDEELATALIEDSARESGLARFIDAPAPHYGDNALELQTPFLARLFPDIPIVAVAVPPGPDAAEAGALAFRTVERLGRRVIALGSTDLTHYGASFGLAPAGDGPEAVAWAKRNDRPFLDALTTLDVDAVVRTALRARTICGGGAAAATAAYARASGCDRGVLLAHASSHDARPEDPADHFVDYAAVAYARPRPS